MNTKHIVILLLFSLLLALTACGSAETTPPPEVQDTAPIEIPQMVQDITVELGSAVAVSDFVIPGMNAADVSLSQGFTLSADAVGETVISFLCSGETQAAKLTVVDTTAPILELHDVAMYTGEIPDAEVFVTACTDFAECTVCYEEEPDMSVFGEQIVVLAATDASGNIKKAEAVLTLYHLYAEVRLEYGEALTAEQLLPMPENDGAMVTEELLQTLVISGTDKKGNLIAREPGDYLVTLSVNADGVYEVSAIETLEPAEEPEPAVEPEAAEETEQTENTEAEEPAAADAAEPVEGEADTVAAEADPVPLPEGDEPMLVLIVRDTLGPVLDCQDFEVEIMQELPGADAIYDAAAAYDPSGIASITVSEYSNEEEGEFPVIVTATDNRGNVSEYTVTLTVTPDMTGPVIAPMYVISLEKNEEKPDYREGVGAKDAVDGYCHYDVDDSAVNYGVTGDYYVKYTSTDKSGNKSTAYRKVTIQHDSSDTAALVAEVVAAAGTDPLAICYYLQDHYRYDSTNGGDDPVYYLLTYGSGNCNCFAKTLRACLAYAGYQAKTIHTTSWRHVWCLVNVGGVWRHIDATPLSKYYHKGLQTDAQKLADLGGYVWDKDAYPACE